MQFISRQFAWHVKAFILGKIRKLFQNVACWILTRMVGVKIQRTGQNVRNCIFGHMRSANAQIKLGNNAVLSESSLSAWRIPGSLGSHWSGCQWRCLFTGRTCLNVHLTQIRVILIVTTLMGKFSRWQNGDIFLIFSGKLDLTSHANCLHWRQFAWNDKTCFLVKIEKYSILRLQSDKR